VIASSAVTDHEVSLLRRLPMGMHLLLDAATGLTLTAVPAAVLGRRGSLRVWVPHAVFGAGELAVAVLTERQPGHKSAPPSAEEDSSGAPAPDGSRTRSASTPASVGQDVEAVDWGDETLVAQEASAAAAEAAMIGGVAPPEADDPAMAPVYQAGGGEQDGWEAAEEELIENATHGDGGGDPLRDAFTPEVESDASGAVYGESDRLPSTELVEDPGTGAADPGSGPGLASERGPGLKPHRDA
jgi:hypothetical protein